MLGIQETECSICLNLLKEDQQEAGTSSEIHTFFFTPCRHKFHRECILKAMDTKRECPLCRTELPNYVNPDIVADDI